MSRPPTVAELRNGSVEAHEAIVVSFTPYTGPPITVDVQRSGNDELHAAIRRANPTAAELKLCRNITTVEGLRLYQDGAAAEWVRAWELR